MTLPTQDTELMLLNPETGETWAIDTMFDPKKSRWEKVFVRALANMLEIVGDEKMKVISFLIRKKDFLNIINCTMQEIADDTGVSKKTVNSTMQILQKHDYIIKVRNGKWRFSPHIMRHGKASIGAAVIKLYENTDGE